MRGVKGDAMPKTTPPEAAPPDVVNDVTAAGIGLGRAVLAAEEAIEASFDNMPV